MNDIPLLTRGAGVRRQTRHQGVTDCGRKRIEELVLAQEQCCQVVLAGGLEGEMPPLPTDLDVVINQQLRTCVDEDVVVHIKQQCRHSRWNGKKIPAIVVDRHIAGNLRTYKSSPKSVRNGDKKTHRDARTSRRTDTCRAHDRAIYFEEHGGILTTLGPSHAGGAEKADSKNRCEERSARN